MTALEHSDGGFTEILGRSQPGRVRGETQKCGRTEGAVKPTRHGEFASEINAEATHENRHVAGLDRFVSDEGEVERHHQHVVAARAKGADKGIVAEATPAMEVAGTGGELKDAHAGSLAQRLCLHQVGCTCLHDVYEKPSAESEQAVT